MTFTSSSHKDYLPLDLSGHVASYDDNDHDADSLWMSYKHGGINDV